MARKMTEWSSRLALIGAGLIILSAPSLEAAEQEEIFDYFTNSWNVIGLKDYMDGTRVTPNNELILAQAKRVRLYYGRELLPLSRKQTKTCLDGWLPILLLSAQDEAIQYKLTLWATPLPNVKNWRRAFDWPTEGENFLNWIRVEVVNTGPKTAEAKFSTELLGDLTWDVTPQTWKLQPNERGETVIRIPFSPLEEKTPFADADASLWLQRTKEFWHGLMEKGARIEVPCTKATQALLAAHVCQFIANDHGVLQGGEGFYDNFYIRDGGYQIMQLEEAGLWDAVEKALPSYMEHRRPDGRFESQKHQLDANGQAVWVLWQYYKITGNRAWLEEVYPAMRGAVEWTKKARRQASEDSPFAGLLPKALADGEYLWDGENHILGYDFWNLRGMLCTADAARTLGRMDEADALRQEAESYRDAIDTACTKTGLAHFPPSWERAGTHWGNTETLWPTELFAPADPRIAASLEEVRERHGGGFAEGTIRWLGWPDAIHPYMSSYSTMSSLIRGDHEQFVEDFYWYLLHTTATHAFPEGIFFKRRFAWSHTIPHVTGASNYAYLLRHMLVHERGDELHLMLGVPDSWLEAGKHIRVERAPTHFGLLSLTVTGTQDGVRIELDAPQRERPERIVLHLPESRPAVDLPEGVKVVTRSDQKRRWDFPTIIQLFKEQPPWLEPIPQTVGVPLDSPVKNGRCKFVDLRPLANADPLNAPFGAVDDKNQRFTGVPLGVHTVAGVPFQIIDPASNNNNGFIILDTAKTPQGIQWPREVSIPVQAKGKRLFFLGNVHGWAGMDTDVAAEYVIYYTDGETQSVPLIPGRTSDNWTRPDEAIEVYPGLIGDTWHLNLLGVTVRAVEIDKIVFRDSGTEAAPLLAAITLEE